MSDKEINYRKVEFYCPFCNIKLIYEEMEHRESYWVEFLYFCPNCGQGVKLIDRQ